MISSIDALEMPEGQGKLLEVQRRQFLVRTVQGMRNRVSQRFLGEIALQIENIVPMRLDLPVLRLSEAPDQR